METGGAAAHLSRLPPGALSTRCVRRLAVSSGGGRGGRTWALLCCPLLDGPPGDLHSEFDLFRGLLLCASRFAGHHRADTGGREHDTRDQPGHVAADLAPHRRGRGLRAYCPWGALRRPVGLPPEGASAGPAVPRSDDRRGACPPARQPEQRPRWGADPAGGGEPPRGAACECPATLGWEAVDVGESGAHHDDAPP